MSHPSRRLDRWVRERPVLTFGLIVALGAVAFWLANLFVRSIAEELGLGPNGDTPLEYAGSALTTVVALAGSLVTVMLARLALNLGEESKSTALRANEIQDQIQLFSDPHYKEVRDGHNAAASLDLIGTLLRQYAAQLVGAAGETRSVDAVRYSFGRANEAISNPAFYLYYSQLVGAGEAAKQFSDIQSRIFTATRKLTGQAADSIAAARGAEVVAIQISKLSRRIELEKTRIVRNAEHHLNRLAQNLAWESHTNRIDGCEHAASEDFRLRLETVDVAAGLNHRSQPDFDDLFSGKKTVVHLIESDVDDFIQWLGGWRVIWPGAHETLNDDVIHRFDSLREYAYGCEQGTRPPGPKLIFANWQSILQDHPADLARDEFKQDSKDFATFGFSTNLESNLIWGRAIFLARHPQYDRLLAAALKNNSKLGAMTLRLVDEEAMLDADDPLPENVEHDAWRAYRHICCIAEHTNRLQALAIGGTAIPFMPWEPYEGLRANSTETVIMVAPFFAPVHPPDQFLPDVEHEHSGWFGDLTRTWQHMSWERR
jgi:hypothetical protein